MLKKIVLVIIIMSIIFATSCQNLDNKTYDIDGIPVTSFTKSKITKSDLYRTTLSKEIIEKFGDIIVECSTKNYINIKIKKYEDDDLKKIVESKRKVKFIAEGGQITMLCSEDIDLKDFRISRLTDLDLQLLEKSKMNIFELDGLYEAKLINITKYFDNDGVEHNGLEVRYFSNDLFCHQFFDENGNFREKYMYSCDKTSEWVKNIKSQYTENDIKKLDESGEYFYCLTEVPPYSVHYTTDGYRIEIYYKEQGGCVDNVHIIEL